MIAAELLRQISAVDKDRYLSLLMMRPQEREVLTPLYAFAVELERIPHLVSEPQLGLIRLQWWRETIGALYQGQAVAHPVAQALLPVISKGALPQNGFEQMIESAETNLLRLRPPNLEALEAHLGGSTSMLMQLSCLSLGVSQAEACGLAGVAYGLMRLLSTGPSWFIPEDILTQGTEQQGLAFLAEHATNRYAQAKAIVIPQAAIPAVLAASLLPLYGASLSRAKPLAPLRRLWTLWRAMRNGKI